MSEKEPRTLEEIQEDQEALERRVDDTVDYMDDIKDAARQELKFKIHRAGITLHKLGFLIPITPSICTIEELEYMEEELTHVMNKCAWHVGRIQKVLELKKKDAETDEQGEKRS